MLNYGDENVSSATDQNPEGLVPIFPTKEKGITWLVLTG